jgi:hypothetical protein
MGLYHKFPVKIREFILEQNLEIWPGKGVEGGGSDN